MRGKYIMVGLCVVVATAAVAVAVFAGDPDNPPGAPGSTFSYTLEDIYNRLDTGAAGSPTTFTEPSSEPGMGTMHTLNEVYQLLGERAPVPKTGQTSWYGLGDDGDLEKGAAWPNPRFADNGNGTVTDNLTGLIWLKNANCFGTRNWTTALSDASTLNSGECGLSDGSSEGDWRLPNVRELQSLVHWGVHSPAVPNTAGTGQWLEGDPFTGVQSYYYWSSTTNADATSYAWYVYLNFGDVVSSGKTLTFYVWPVRGGQ